MGTQAYQQLRDAIAISERTSAGRVSLFVMVVECRRLDWRIRCVALAQSPMRPYYTHRHTDRDCACMHVMYATCVCMTKSDSICKQPLLCVWFLKRMCACCVGGKERKSIPASAASPDFLRKT